MIHDKPGRAQRRRNHVTDSQLKELIDDLLSRHNLTNLAFAQDYCHMPHQTFSAIVSGSVERPRVDNIGAILRGVLTLEPNYPIERIYSVLDLPIPRFTRPAPDLPAPIAAIVASLGDMDDAQLARLEAALTQETADVQSPAVQQPKLSAAADAGK